jgi:hypothetical protein
VVAALRLPFGLVDATPIPLSRNEEERQEYEGDADTVIEAEEGRGWRECGAAWKRHFGQRYQSLSMSRNGWQGAGRVVVSSTIWSHSVHVMENCYEDLRAIGTVGSTERPTHGGALWIADASPLEGIDDFNPL